jgi:hypothetical protein
MTAQILLFTGVRRDSETGREDITALLKAAELAGKVRRFPIGLRALPAPIVAAPFCPPPVLFGAGCRQIEPVTYDELAEDDGA